MTANPVAFLQLSQQVTDTLKEVRSEIGELKCEMKSVRDNARKPIISTANALVKLQTKEIQSDFQQIIDTKKREESLELLIQWATSFIKQKNREVIEFFQGDFSNRTNKANYLEGLIEIAIITIDNQRKIIDNIG